MGGCPASEGVFDLRIEPHSDATFISIHGSVISDTEISELGWTGTAIPEEYGGLGLGMLELCVIAEELGRSLAPTPFSSSIYLFAEFLKSYGNEDQKQKYLPKIASGELIGTFALSETNGTPRPNNIKSEVPA